MKLVVPGGGLAPTVSKETFGHVPPASGSTALSGSPPKGSLQPPAFGADKRDHAQDAPHKEGAVAVPLPNRLGIQFSADAEARFLSHHDTMRLMARAARRARLPVAYSGGFNPRPRLSLPLPRPVGIAGRQELLVLELAEPMDADEAIQRLAGQMPQGLVMGRPVELTSKRSPQAESADYALPIAADVADAVAARLAQLAAESAWPCTRPQGHPGDRRGQASSERQLDLRELITRLAFDGETLTFTLVPRQQVWARVDEVLALLGLDLGLRASVIRTSICWQGNPDPSTEATDGTQE